MDRVQETKPEKALTRASSDGLGLGCSESPVATKRLVVVLAKMARHVISAGGGGGELENKESDKPQTPQWIGVGLDSGGTVGRDSNCESVKERVMGQPLRNEKACNKREDEKKVEQLRMFG